MHPLYDKLLVKRKDAVKQRASGIILTSVASDKPAEGEVLQVGPGKTTKSGVLITPECQVGDKIICNKGSGDKITMDGENYLLLSETDVYGIIE